MRASRFLPRESKRLNKVLINERRYHASNNSLEQRTSIQHSFYLLVSVIVDVVSILFIVVAGESNSTLVISSYTNNLLAVIELHNRLARSREANVGVSGDSEPGRALKRLPDIFQVEAHAYLHTNE